MTQFKTAQSFDLQGFPLDKNPPGHGALGPGKPAFGGCDGQRSAAGRIAAPKEKARRGGVRSAKRRQVVEIQVGDQVDPSNAIGGPGAFGRRYPDGFGKL